MQSWYVKVAPVISWAEFQLDFHLFLCIFNILKCSFLVLAQVLTDLICEKQYSSLSYCLTLMRSFVSFQDQSVVCYFRPCYHYIRAHLLFCSSLLVLEEKIHVAFLYSYDKHELQYQRQETQFCAFPPSTCQLSFMFPRLKCSIG